MSTIDLDSSNFDSTIAEGIVFVDWWAPWCGPCRAFAPIYDKASEKHPNVTFAKVNTEDNRQLGAEFAVRSIPTLMVFRDGLLVFSQAGMLPGRVLDDLVRQVENLDMDAVRAKVAEAARQTA